MKRCIACNKLFYPSRGRSSIKYCSQNCAHQNTRKISLTKEELEELLKTKNINQLSKELNISYNGLKKYIKKYNIILIT